MCNYILRKLLKRDIIIAFLLWLTALSIIFTGIRPYAGGDGPGEIWRSNYSAEYGWDWTAKDHNNASVVLGLITPFISEALDLNMVNVFRDILPLWYALTPVLLFILFRKFMPIPEAVLASLFFAVLPPSYQEIPNIGKSMVAEPLAVMTLLTVLNNRQSKGRILLGVTFSLLTLAAHYTVGIMLLLWLGAACVARRKTAITGVLVISALLGIVYLSIAGGSAVMDSLIHWGNLPDHHNDVIVNVLKGQEFQTYTSGSSPEIEQSRPGRPADVKKEYSQPIAERLNSPLFLPLAIPYWVRTGAIYLATLMLALGGGYWIWHWRLMEGQRGLAGIIILAALSVILALFVPFMTRGLFLTRWIQLAGIPMSALYGLGTRLIPWRHSYLIGAVILLLLLVLAR